MHRDHKAIEVQRIAVIQRGEAALRFLKTAQVMTPRVEAVLLYTQDEMNSSVFWAYTNRQLLKGDAHAYEDSRAVLEAIHEAQCDSAWLGWGFASEKASFVSALEVAGITVLAPRPHTLSQLGDKGRAQSYADQAGFNLIPSLLIDLSEKVDPQFPNQALLTHLLNQRFEQAISNDELPPLPWLLKATEGGGGRGIFKWDEGHSDQQQVIQWMTDATLSVIRAGLIPRFILETRLIMPRHIELQILGDGQGNTIVLGARECSVQRRHQKLIEECPPNNLAKHVLNKAIACAQNLGSTLEYRGVGTVELLYNSEREMLYFLEVNPRLQVEHPITELVYGLDLIEAQIRIAREEPLPTVPSPRGVAIEARLYAEDPAHEFMPTSGRLVRFRIPSGPGVRVDSGYQEGDHVEGNFDPMLAKVIAYTPTREATILRLKQVLSSSQVLIEGGAANHHYLKDILSQSDFKESNWHTQKLYLPEPPSLIGRGVALLARGIDLFLSTAEPNRLTSPQAHLIAGELPIRIYRLGSEQFLCLHERTLSTQSLNHQSGWLLVEYRSLNECARSLTLDKQSYHIECIPGDARYWVNGEAHDLTVADDDSISARSRGVVLDIMIEPGSIVTEGQELIKIESMKVEVCITSPRDGVVSVIYSELEQVVNPGELLISLKPIHTETVNRVSQLPWSTKRLDPLHLLKASVVGWDFVPLPLWGDISKQFNIDDHQQLLTSAEYFLDIACIFDRRSKEAPLAQLENHALAAQPKRMIFAYLEGEESSLPEIWISTFKTCLERLRFNHTYRLPTEHNNKWASVRLIYSAQFLDQIGAQLSDFLSTLDTLPLTLLDRLGALDPERFPTLVGLADERSMQLSLELSSQRSNQAEFELWLSTDEEANPLPLTFHVEAAIAPLFEYAQRGDQRAFTRLIEALDPFYELTSLDRDVKTSILALYLSAKKRIFMRGQTVQSIEPSSSVWLIYDRQTQGTEVLSFVQRSLIDHVGSIKQLWVLDLSTHPLYKESHGQSSLRPDLQLLIDQLFDTTNHPIFSVLRKVTLVGAPAYQNAVIGQSRTVHVSHFSCDHREDNRIVLKEEKIWRDLTPKQVQRINARRWTRFSLMRNLEDEYAIYEAMNKRRETFSAIFRLSGLQNPEDIRLVTYAEVYQFNRRRGRPLVLPEVDHAFYLSLRLLHKALKEQKSKTLFWNRLILRILPPIPLGLGVIKRYMRRLVSAARWVGLEKVIVRARFLDKSSQSGLSPLMDVSIYQFVGREVSLVARPSDDQPILTRTKYESQVVSARKRGLTHPAEVIHLLEGGGSGVPRGIFTLFDYDDVSQKLIPINSEKIFGGASKVVDDGQQERSKCGVFIGEISTSVHKPQMTLRRIVILSDPTIKLAALGLAECDRIIAALKLASQECLPIEWLTVSSGAKIDWDTGTENLDACARVLKEIIRFTHSGGMINILVTGTSVGAQSYWNAEATMMNHCCGTLIMTDRGSMVLTGKRALDISGCVSASDDLELGGYTSIMGPNGQAQIHALDLVEAYQKLYSFYRLCYLSPTQTRVQFRTTKDSTTRDIGSSPYPSALKHPFTQIAHIFSSMNQERKRPFSVKPIMEALKDHDDIHLERWGAWEGAETVVVWQCRVAGFATTMIGIENQSIQRLSPSIDGPRQWQGGTLYPQASRKLARALNASQSRYPVVILANLSGFDGSPESLRLGQLEYGSEIAQAVQRFTCPIYFIILSRYHGGAYVVFSKQLNPMLEAIAIEGSYASVIGGGPAASIILKRDVHHLAQSMGGTEQAKREASKVIATRFDQTHDIQRALHVGSIDQILKLSELRSVLSQKLAKDYKVKTSL